AINTGLSGLPYWGTDIGGFYGTTDFTGELYVRWFQFAAFCPLFRSHGRNWHLHTPWGWDGGDGGPPETQGLRADPTELHNQYVDEPVDEPLTLIIYPGTNGTSSMYEDDGKSFAFRQGASMRLTMAWQDTQRRLSLRLASGSQMMPPVRRTIAVRVAGSTETK